MYTYQNGEKYQFLLYQDYKYSKTCLKRPLKRRQKNWFSRPIIASCKSKVLQNALLEHSSILQYLIFIKLPFVFKTFVLSNFEWSLKGRNHVPPGRGVATI